MHTIINYILIETRTASERFAAYGLYKGQIAN